MHQLGEADDRVERRAQLVRHVGEELALQPVGLEDAAVLLLDRLVLQARRLGPLAFGDVAGDGDPGARPGRRHDADGELDLHLGAVGAQRRHLDAPADQRAATAGGVAREPVAVRLAKGRRHQEIGQLAAEDVRFPKAEGLLGRGIEFEHAAGRVNRDHAVERDIDDGAVVRFAFAQRIERAIALDHLRLELPARERDAGHHLVECAAHPADLVLARRGDPPGQVAGRHFVRGAGQSVQRPRHPYSQASDDERADGDDEERDQDHALEKRSRRRQDPCAVELNPHAPGRAADQRHSAQALRAVSGAVLGHAHTRQIDRGTGADPRQVGPHAFRRAPQSDDRIIADQPAERVRRGDRHRRSRREGPQRRGGRTLRRVNLGPEVRVDQAAGRGL